MVYGAALRDQGKHAELAALAALFAADAPEPRIDTSNGALPDGVRRPGRGQEKLSAEEQKRLVDGYSERAVKLLQKATQAGYASGRDERDHIDKDSDLAVLRPRADDKALLARLDARLPPVPQTPSQAVHNLITE